MDLVSETMGVFAGRGQKHSKNRDQKGKIATVFKRRRAEKSDWTGRGGGETELKGS